MSEKRAVLLEEKNRREKVVRKKWDSLIASLEQEEMVIDRDRKMVAFSQQGKGMWRRLLFDIENEFEAKIKELSSIEGEEKERERQVIHSNQEIMEHVSSLREKK